jgi:predicted RNase H-like nuclease (RuvC/YqgF family)
MKFSTNRHKYFQLFIFTIYFTSIFSFSDAQTFNPNIQIDYTNNLLTLSAKKADLKNVLLKLSEKTGIYVRFPNSLKKQITTKMSEVSLKEALSKILKGMNHAIVYSGSKKNRTVVSEVFVYMKPNKSILSRRSTSRNKQIEARIRSYERRLDSLNEKLSKFDKNGRQGKRYLRQIRSYQNVIESLKKRIR